MVPMTPRFGTKRGRRASISSFEPSLINESMASIPEQIESIDDIDLSDFVDDEERPKDSDRGVCHFKHFVDGFSAEIDNGGMSVDEVDELLTIAEHHDCLKPVAVIATEALRERVSSISFDELGVVDLRFLRLSPEAMRAILSGEALRIWSENDIFLAVTQWAAYPQPTASDDTDPPNDAEYGRFDFVQKEIRYHLMDRWFLSIVAKHYLPLHRNKEAVLEAMSGMSLCHPANPTNP